SVRPRLGIQLVLWAFVLPGRPRCSPDRETPTETRQGVHLAGGVGRGGWRLADGCGAGVLGQWRQHSQQALRRLTEHDVEAVLEKMRQGARGDRPSPALWAHHSFTGGTGITGCPAFAPRKRGMTMRRDHRFRGSDHIVSSINPRPEERAPKSGLP